MSRIQQVQIFEKDRYVRDWEAKKHHFEVIVGKSTLAFRREDEDETPASKRLGFVQTLDAKPKRRLFEVLTLQGMQLNQQITFLSDGSDTVRALQLYMSPEAEHLLDWHHVTMRLTVLGHYAKGLVHCDAGLGEEIREKIERLKWALWHGNLYKAFYKIEDIEALIYNFEETYPKFKPLRKAVEEFRTYIRNNRHLIQNPMDTWHDLLMGCSMCGRPVPDASPPARTGREVSARSCRWSAHE